MRRNGNERGFTLIELIIIIVVLGLLSMAAFPIYQDLTSDADDSAEKTVVGHVLTGISLYFVNSAKSGGTPSYPSELDSEGNNKEASEANPLFTNVIQGGVTEGWIKQNSTKYIGPAGNIYEYSSVTGTFTLKG